MRLALVGVICQLLASVSLARTSTALVPYVGTTRTPAPIPSVYPYPASDIICTYPAPAPGTGVRACTYSEIQMAIEESSASGDPVERQNAFAAAGEAPVPEPAQRIVCVQDSRHGDIGANYTVKHNGMDLPGSGIVQGVGEMPNPKTQLYPFYQTGSKATFKNLGPNDLDIDGTLLKPGETKEVTLNSTVKKTDVIRTYPFFKTYYENLFKLTTIKPATPTPPVPPPSPSPSMSPAPTSTPSSSPSPSPSVTPSASPISIPTATIVPTSSTSSSTLALPMPRTPPTSQKTPTPKSPPAKSTSLPIKKAPVPKSSKRIGQ